MHARRLLFAVAALSLARPAPARAGNDDELLVGSRAAMTAGTVGATVMDGSASWYNPAGLGAIDRDQVDVSGTVYTLRVYAASDFLALQSGESDDASVVEFLAVRYAFSDGTVNGLLGDPAAPDGNWVAPHQGRLRTHEIGLYVGSGLRF